MPTLSVHRRRWFLQTALAYLGTPYRWGGDDPSGFDCSGLVVECLKSAGVLSEQEDLTAEQLRQRFGAASSLLPEKARLLFRMDHESGQAVHVAICLDRYFLIGALGGDKSILDTGSALSKNAFVRIRPIRINSGHWQLADPFHGG